MSLAQFSTCLVFDMRVFMPAGVADIAWPLYDTAADNHVLVCAADTSTCWAHVPALAS